jgi:hypothetical protein
MRRAVLRSVFALSASATAWCLDVAPELIDLGQIGSECIEMPFSLRAKSNSGCPLVETNCGCIAVHRDRATQDAEGWWTIPMTRTFGLRSGRESQALTVRDQGTSQSATVRVLCDIQMVATLGYSGILMWSTAETSRREQAVNLDFSSAITVSSIKAEAPADSQFIASVKRLSSDARSWIITVRPRRTPLRQTVFPESISISVVSSSPRIGTLRISAMATPPAP